MSFVIVAGLATPAQSPMVSRKRRLSRSPAWHDRSTLDWVQLQHCRHLGP